ncbi:hypothetical protein GCM10023085_17360 [Actinomadura viridis]
MKATTVYLAAALLTQGIAAGHLLSSEDGSRLHHVTGGAVTIALSRAPSPQRDGVRRRRRPDDTGLDHLPGPHRRLNPWLTRG